MRKMLVAFCFSLIAMLVIPTEQLAMANAKFTDVGSTHRAKEEIYYLNNKGIVNGVTNTQFAPDKNVTRAEAAIMLGRAIGVKASPQNTKFTDVTQGNGASGYIQVMADKGIISGYPDGSFKPSKTLTRGEMALLINRAFNWETGSVSAAANKLVELGIAQGMSDGSFGSQNLIKRADFAVFIARSIEPSFRVPSTGKPTPPNPDPKPEEFKTVLYVNAGSDTLNMRKGPGTSYGVVTKLTTGTKVLRASTTGSWSYIKVGNQVGYVHSNYLTANPKPEETHPATPGDKKLSDLVIVIDPGHGGTDPGSLGNGLKEKDVLLKIGLKMAKYYDKTPMKASLTRSTDTFIPLSSRSSYASKVNGDIFVSIHANAFSSSSANGQETYYYRTAARNKNVQESRALAIYTQFRMREAWNLRDRGVKEGNLHVLRENSVPSVLAEIGFITNANDAKYMKSDVELEKMARGLFLATLDYYYYYEGRKDILPLYNTVGAQPSGKRH